MYEGPFQLEPGLLVVVGDGSGNILSSNDEGVSWSTGRTGRNLFGCRLQVGGLVCGSSEGFGYLRIRSSNTDG